MQVTCFSDSEENTVGKSHLVPFLPEARLRELGGLYEKVPLSLHTSQRGQDLAEPTTSHPGGIKEGGTYSVSGQC